MKLNRTISIVALSAACVFTLSAQTRPTPTDPAPTRPTPTPPVVERPATPARPELPAEVKALLDEFRQARESYVAEQKELTKQLRGATDAERDTIREQMKTNRQELAEAQKKLHSELRALRATLKDHARPADAARDGRRPGS